MVCVSCRRQSELHGRWHRWLYTAGQISRAHRQPGVGIIFELLDAGCHDDVVYPSSNGETGIHESVGRRGTSVFHSGNGDVVEFQRVGEKLAGEVGAYSAHLCSWNILGLE